MEPRQFGRFACMASSKIKIEIRAPKVRTKGIRSKVTNVPVTQDGWPASCGRGKNLNTEDPSGRALSDRCDLKFG